MNMVTQYLNFSYRKVGGLHFIKLGRFGASFYISQAEGEQRTHTRAPITTEPLPPITMGREYSSYSSAADTKEEQARAHKFY